MVVSLSDDRIRFDRHFKIADEIYEMKKAGLHKGGQYGYPHTLIFDGNLYAIVSRLKEAMKVIRLPLDAFDE